MNIRTLFAMLLLLPILASAEVYKWKDKDGVMRYSDIPPPSNIKQEPMAGKKKVQKPTGLQPLAPVEGDATAAMNKEKAADKATVEKGKVEKAPPSKDEAAQKRAQDADAQKKLDDQKKAELKVKQENCAAAKSNLMTYNNGGRISKMSESGERVFLSDEDINKGKVDAQRDVEKYCE